MKKLCIAFSAAGMVAAALAQFVAFKDAAKIKSWDAWSDHKGKKEQKARNQRPCVTWV